MRPTGLTKASNVPWLLTSVLALAACAPGPDAATETGTDPLDLAVDSQALVLPAGIKSWTAAKNRTIPMCWHELLQFSGKGPENEARAFVMRTIQEGWISLLNLKISWEDCPTSGTSTHVRVKLRAGDGKYHGTTKALGMDTLSTPAARLPQPPDDAPGLLMGIPTVWNQETFRSLILHEFGHILGFVDDLACTDPTSLMAWSYCPTSLGVVTASDAWTTRASYGYGRAAANDFNNDGRADIVWHNSSTLYTQIWSMSGSTRIGRLGLLNQSGNDVRIGPPWHNVGGGDFNSDGWADILWHNDTTNETQLWYMNGNRLAYPATVLAENGSPIFVGVPWRIVGTGDFNSDGLPDILWHNDATNATQIWFLAGGKIIGRTNIQDESGQTIFVGLPWHIVGTGDFTGDGKPDILWRNDTTYANQVWAMNGSRIFGRGNIAYPVNEYGQSVVLGPQWRIAGANDFNQDGWSDILWHNDTSGEIAVWTMNGISVTRQATVDVVDGGSPLITPPWHIMPYVPPFRAPPKLGPAFP